MRFMVTGCPAFAVILFGSKPAMVMVILMASLSTGSRAADLLIIKYIAPPKIAITMTMNKMLMYGCFFSCFSFNFPLCFFDLDIFLLLLISFISGLLHPLLQQFVLT